MLRPRPRSGPLASLAPLDDVLDAVVDCFAHPATARRHKASVKILRFFGILRAIRLAQAGFRLGEQ